MHATNPILRRTILSSEDQLKLRSYTSDILDDTIQMCNTYNTDRKWKELGYRHDLKTYVMQNNSYGLMGVRDIEVDVEDLFDFVTVDSNDLFKASMKFLYKKSFVDSFIVYQEQELDQDPGLPPSGVRLQQRPSGLGHSNQEISSNNSSLEKFSLKWFALQSGNLVGKHKDFYMMEHVKVVDCQEHPKRRLFAQVMEPIMHAAPLSFVDPTKYTRALFRIALVAEPKSKSDRILDIRCVALAPACASLSISTRLLMHRIVHQTLKNIEDAIILQRLSKKTFALPQEWIRNEDRQRCSICAVAFNVFTRRHHCRICGDIVCFRCCSTRKAYLSTIGTTKVKICVICFCSAYRRSKGEYKSSIATTHPSFGLSNNCFLFEGTRSLHEHPDASSLNGGGVCMGRTSDLGDSGLVVTISSSSPDYGRNSKENHIISIPHFSLEKERNRLEQLKKIGFYCPSPNNKIMQLSCSLFSHTLSVDSAFIGFVGELKLIIRHQVGINVKEVNRRDTLSDFILASKDPKILSDCLRDEIFASIPMVEALKIRFFAAIPIFISNIPIGFICGFDILPRVDKNNCFAYYRGILIRLSKMISTELERDHTLRKCRRKLHPNISHSSSSPMDPEKWEKLKDGDMLYGRESTEHVIAELLNKAKETHYRVSESFS